MFAEGRAQLSTVAEEADDRVEFGFGVAEPGFEAVCPTRAVAMDKSNALSAADSTARRVQRGA